MEIKTQEVGGFYSAIQSMRNPMNSWGLSDSSEGYAYNIGDKDLKLAQNLIKSGTEHAKFLRMIQVWVDMDMTRFFFSEFDTYKFNVKNSCSTIFKLLNKNNEISLDMFEYYKEDELLMIEIVKQLNHIREMFLDTDNYEEQCKLKRRAKCLLPEGFLQLRTVNTNYAELRNIVLQRKNHQMKKDWQETFCKWVTTLPYSKELIFCGIEEEYERLSNL